jgi:hypothetical protein
MNKNAIMPLMLLFFAVIFFSCYQDEDKDSPADYSVLGLESITVMDRQLNFREGGLLDTAGVSGIVIDGLLVQGKQSEVTCTVLIHSDETPYVGNVTSVFPDVSIGIQTETNDGRTSCFVRIKREGYQERLTYIFGFIIKP